MLNYGNSVDGLSLIHFCENLSQLSSFELIFSTDNDIENESEQELIENMDPNSPSDSNLDRSTRVHNSILKYVVFMIKLEMINFTNYSNAQEMVKAELKKNLFLSKMWHVTVIYVIFILVFFILAFLVNLN